MAKEGLEIFVRIEPRALAALARYAEITSHRPMSRADLVRSAINKLAEVAAANIDVKFDDETAIEYLNKVLPPRGRAATGMFDELFKEKTAEVKT